MSFPSPKSSITALQRLLEFDGKFIKKLAELKPDSPWDLLNSLSTGRLGSMSRKPHPGVLAALTAAVLFGASTPLSKLLLDHTSPLLLASLLYLGSGVGLFLLRLARRSAPVRLPPGESRWLIAAILSGGVVAPVLLMTGLAAMPASGASLLLNAEGVFTALLAWFAFKENFDRRIALGMVAIVVGALVLSWPPQGKVEFSTLLALPRRFRRMPRMGIRQQFHSQSVTD